jgi:hypothetical protein
MYWICDSDSGDCEEHYSLGGQTLCLLDLLSALKKEPVRSFEILPEVSTRHAKYIFICLWLFIPTVALRYYFELWGLQGTRCVILVLIADACGSTCYCAADQHIFPPVLLSTTKFLNSKSRRDNVIIYKLHLGRVFLSDSSMAVQLFQNQVLLQLF